MTESESEMVLTPFRIIVSCKTFGTSSVWWRIGFLLIFTVAFLLFLAPSETIFKPYVANIYSYLS